MIINAIVCHDSRYGIGKNNSIPWKNEADMKFFKRFTENQVVIMGSNTANSLPNGYLANRNNIIISSKHPDNFSDNCYVAENLEDAIKFAIKEFPLKEIYVIGGNQVYNSFIKLSDKDYNKRFIINSISGDFDCDTFLDIEEIKKAFKNVNIHFDYSLSINRIVCTLYENFHISD